MSKVLLTAKLYSIILLLLVAVFFNTAIQSQSLEKQSHIPDSYGFIVKGTTGSPVMLDATWYQEAKPDGNGGWTRSMRTMSGNELNTTIITYKKKPTEATRFSGATMVTTFVQTLTNDNVMVPITWVDEAGKPAKAPQGLEHIKEANGATGIVTYASLTPLNWKTAFGLNYVKFAGMKGWKKRVTVDLLPFFSSIGAMKGCVVVDNRTGIGAVYDGISTNPKEYPTLMPNTTPHKGKLNGIKF